jgi:two-component system phosphate regulon response regulator OmpR
MENRCHILVVDDDTRLRSLLYKYLRDHQFIVSEAANAAEARLALSLLKFDLMVLDVMMPKETGLELASSLNSLQRPPILMLTALDTPSDRVAGLEAGVEDYLAKPFEPRELLLRINNILKNKQILTTQKNTLQFGEFVFDKTSQSLTRNGRIIPLTGVELTLLSALAEQPAVSLSRDALAAKLGGEENSRSVDVQIGRLRKKIEEDTANPRFIHTVRGEGYKLLLG